MMRDAKLSERQKKMLETIRDHMFECGYPPTIREIGRAAGITSTSVVTYNLKSLERKGYLSRDSEVSRGLRLVDRPGIGVSGSFGALGRDTVSIPLLGVIAAGEPIPVPDSDSPEAALGYISLAADFVKSTESVYALRVQGDSMIEDLIADGDIVIMRHQEMAENGNTVAAWLKGEKATTLKRFYLEEDQQRVRLQPRNPALEPIYVDPGDVEIQGKVIGVIRQME